MDKFEKRRRNNKFINYSIITASVLVLFLIGIWIFGGGEDEQAEEDNVNKESDDYFLEQEEEEAEEEASSDVTIIDQEDEEDENNSEENNGQDEESEQEENVALEEVESDDPNVKEAVTGDWPPVGTDQTEPHEQTDFNRDSLDWIEIKRAASMVTGIPEDKIIEHWIGNGGGPQKVIATISEEGNENGEIYRIYMDWVEEEGWQPHRVETLHELDLD
jgi:hypothetical protein